MIIFMCKYVYVYLVVNMCMLPYCINVIDCFRPISLFFFIFYIFIFLYFINWVIFMYICTYTIQHLPGYIYAQHPTYTYVIADG